MHKPFFVTTSWDDGSVYDLRLAELLTKYKVGATFYVPIQSGERQVLKAGKIRELAKEFEIGSHSFLHVDLTKLSFESAYEQIRRGRQELEDIISKKVSSFCYPRGGFNQKIKHFVGFCGFEFARTAELFASVVEDKLAAHTTSKAADHNLLTFARRGGFCRPLGYRAFLSALRDFRWDVFARLSLDYCLENGGMFHLWGHSWEIEKNNDWKRLESFFRYIRENTDAKSRGSNAELIKFLSGQKKAYYEAIDPEKYNSNLSYLHSFSNIYNREGIRILDIGCADGRASTYFPKADYVGIDYSQNFISYARRNFEGEFICGDYGHILGSKPLGKFDLILILGLFEDETNPFKKAEYILGRVGRRGTRLLFTLNNSQSIFFKLTKASQILRGKLKFPYTSFSRSVLENYFKEVEIEEKNGFLLVNQVYK